MTLCSLSFLRSSIQCKGALAWHQLSCTIHKQSFVSRQNCPQLYHVFLPFQHGMDCIHKHHWCFPFRLISSSFIPPYSTYSSSWFSIIFAYTFISISIQSFWYYNLAFFLLFFFWCLSFPPKGGEKGYQDICIRLHRYMGDNLETLLEEHTIKTLILAFCRCLKTITWILCHLHQHDYTLHGPLLM